MYLLADGFSSDLRTFHVDISSVFLLRVFVVYIYPIIQLLRVFVVYIYPIIQLNTYLCHALASVAITSDVSVIF